jgi:hypothetical protein
MYISIIHQLTSHTSAYVRIRQHTYLERLCSFASTDSAAFRRMRHHLLAAYVCIRQHTPDTSAYVSIRQHTSAYVSIRQQVCGTTCLPSSMT